MSNPDYPRSGLSDSSENAHPWIGKLLERPKNSQSKGWLIQGLAGNSEVGHIGGVCQHAQEKLQELVFLLLFTSPSFKCRLSPCQQGGATPPYAAGSQVSPNPPREEFGKGEHMVSVVFSMLRPGSCRGSFAGELPHSPRSQLPAKGTRQKTRCIFLSFRMHVCLCIDMCVPVPVVSSREHVDSLFFLSLSTPAHSSIMPQKYLAPLLQLQNISTRHQCHSPCGVNKMKDIPEVKELVGLAAALFFGLHWWWQQDTLNLV